MNLDSALTAELIERITDRVLAEMGEPDDGGSRWLTDPLNDTCFRCRRSHPRELLLEAPDRVGMLPLHPPAGRQGTAESPPLDAVARSIAGIIDHTLLKPDATPRDIEDLCHEAVRYRFKSVCVNPMHVRLASQVVGSSGVLVCAVVGFPLGATLTDVKAYEARRALEEGASELDMVLPVGMLIAGRHSYVAHDILEVVRAAESGTVVKVILETCLLDEEQKVTACRLAREAGASFVKTSTGFSTGGATPEDVRLMRREVGGDMGVKAS
ncbi:MAG: deoxyribose-phosphate aldolase, partial [Planctomycetota bacterium]